MAREDEEYSYQREHDELARVLHGQQKKLNGIEDGINAVADQRHEISNELDDLMARADALCQQAGIDSEATSGVPIILSGSSSSSLNTVHTWDDLLNEYADIRSEELSLDVLLPAEVVARIDARYDAPLRRLPWDKWDYAVAFGSGLIGIITDWFCAPVGNPLSEKLKSYGASLHDKGPGGEGVQKAFTEFQNRLGSSELAKRFPWVEKLTQMDVSHDNLPIDFHGKHFGGTHHRGLSSGHDLLRFMSAIWQIKNGQFVGVRYEHGRAIMDIVGSQAGGGLYHPMDWTTAIVSYLLHIAADFFTATSIPIPGATLLRELPDRDVRTFVQSMYEDGVNLRHMVGQAVTPTVTSLVILLYDILRYRLPNWYRKNVKKLSIDDEPVPGLKFNEMMAVAHTLVTGVNVGRVIITKNPTTLNLPELMTFMGTMYKLAMSNMKRHSIEARYERNKLYLDDGWGRVDAFVDQSVGTEDISWPKSPILV